VALEDLVAEGNLGLLRAVEGFDPAFGTRFSTYAAFWVKQSIRVALNKYGHTVRLPQYLAGLLGRWRPAELALRETLGRAPLPAEVVAFLGLTERRGRSVVKGLKVVGSARATGGDEEVDPASHLSDGRAEDPSGRLAAADDAREVLGLVDRLGGRDAAVLRLRFGLDGGEPMTLVEVGHRFGLTRERARQIEQSALLVLRGHLAV
jgi:RNA polymerase primary sigma factor